MDIGLKRVKARRKDALAGEAWERIEQLLADYYRGQGYAVDHCGTGARRTRFDGGVDLRLRRDTDIIVVQCKHWNAYKVPHNEVHQLLGIMVNEQATGAILVTSGEFTKAAIEAASRHGHVQLIDGDDLREMLGPLYGDGRGAPGQERGQLDGWRASPATFGSYAAERLISAAEDRVRHGGKGRGRSIVAASAWAGLGAILIKFVLALALIYFGTMYLQRAVRNMAPASHAATSRSAPQESAPPRADRQRMQQREAQAAIVHQPAPRDVQEWRRRNAESMEILGETTPELPVDPRRRVHGTP
ncbi:restriction endonuclease [Luteimonas sp. A501]